MSLSLGNGLATSYQYWGVEYRPLGSENLHYGLVRSVVTGSRQSLTYDYDPKGNLLSLVDGRTSETISFGYDHLDRLIQASGAVNEGYGYDAIGNFTSKGGVGYGYPAVGSRPAHGPTTVGGNSYLYDGNGNLTSAEGRGYVYDVENRLTSVSGASLPARGFEYDGDGVLRKTTQDGALKTRYVTGDYQVDGSGEVFVYYRFGGRAVAWHGSGAMRYPLKRLGGSEQPPAAAGSCSLPPSRFPRFLRERGTER